MMSEDGKDRRGPPGVNSKSLAAANSDPDLEVLKEIDNVYFSPPSEFDAGRYALTHAPDAPEDVDAVCVKLKRQLQVVSSKALHLISQQKDNCDREFAEIQKIRDDVTQTLQTCRKARENLKMAANHLTISSFVILANYRKRKVIKSVLKSLQLLRDLRSVECDVTEMLVKQEYEKAIELILKSLKAASVNKEYTCIADLAVRLQDTLDMTEEKLDTVLASVCYNFDAVLFAKLRRAYDLLNKTQAAMEQLHMYYSSAINKSAVDAIKPYIGDKDGKFHEICQSVPNNKAPVCLLNLCENMFLIMKSYYLLVNWHTKNDDCKTGTNVMDIERNVSREYIRQKLKAGLERIWNDVQAKVSIFLKNSGLEEYPFEKFIQMLGVLRKLTQVAEVFCGDRSDVLQEFIKNHSVTYIKNYHRGRMEELKLFLENEGWEQCPVKSSFTLLNLQEFKQFKKYLNPTISDTSVTKSQSEGTSSVHSQDDSVYIAKYFNARSSKTPFEIFHKDNVTNDYIFGIETEYVSTDSEDEPEELKREYLDDGDDKETPSPSKVSDSVIVTNTTLSVLRNCGQYLQICRFLPQISLEVIMLMNQLFDYYFYTVHAYFTSDLDVAKSTLYTTKLSSTLKRISNNVDDGRSENKFLPAELPSHLDMSSEETLHGLSERIVGVESVVFLAKQYEMLQPYLETIVSGHQKMILEHFKENTLAVAEDVRMPVYMTSISKAVDAKMALIAMSQVKWDMKSIAEQHSPYIEMLLRRIQWFTLRLEVICTKVTMNQKVLSSLWCVMSKFIVHLLVEGFSNATKCSNGGRGLMQLDYRQLFVKLETISNIKPLPFQDYVDKYVKAYYLPRVGLEDFVRERNEYSNKHLLALVTCACDNKRDRQELIQIIENKE